MPPQRLIASGGNVIVDPGISLTMLSGNASISWAVYEVFNAGSECDAIELQYSNATTPVYLAVADFGLGRWNIVQQFTAGSGSLFQNIDQQAWYSPLHRQYVALIAADGGDLRIDNFEYLVERMDQVPGIAIDAANPGIEAVECNGRPAIVYKDESDRLLFALANSASPAGPADWTTSEITSSEFCYYWRVEMHKGKPVVLYVDENDSSLWIAAASKSLPLQVGDWQKQQLIAAGNCARAALCSDGQRLHITSFERDPLDINGDFIYGYLGYARSVSGDPLGSFSYSRIYPLGDATGAYPSQPDICIIDGTPSIAVCNLRSLSTDELLYIHALNADPAPVDWDWQVLVSNVDTGQLWLDQLSGAPVIAYRDSVLNMIRSYKADPQLPADWTITNVSIAGCEPTFSLLSLNGSPALAYVVNTGNFNLNIQFSSHGSTVNPPWEEFNLIQQHFAPGSPDNPDPRLISVAGRPALMYYDFADSAIHYNRFDND
ncbi:hypothetical protein KDL29_05635 [bacterium]|nr:hypothetical protein [bacterium]